MKIEPLGDSALIVRVVDEFARDPDASLSEVLAALRALEAASIPSVIELAPAYTTVAVFFDPTRVAPDEIPETPFDWLRAKIEKVLKSRPALQKQKTESDAIEVPVCYEGEFAPDLPEVARHAGLSEDEVVRRHSSASYRVNCLGFTPGFPFLSGLPAELATPRRVTPRKEIPAGAVGIGGAQTGIYPRKSPGGWNLMGRTPLRLFDVQREPPALFQAGDRVRFRKISREEFDALSG
ncbi:MAG TPA: 5-oxoprolinase subunit PxpB [Chthoniobacterales bacterium]|nr:5-oxoprolinase subunit PxpB [Chthoniobacterales bacterium]